MKIEENFTEFEYGLKVCITSKVYLLNSMWIAYIYKIYNIYPYFMLTHKFTKV